jgi:iron complex outermembrane receptor protein
VRENFNTRTGFAGRYAFFSSQSNDPRAIPSSFNFSGAPFLRMEYFTGKFRIVAGLRVDIFRVPSIAFFSPQAIVTYKPSQDILLRLSYLRYSRSPFISNVFGDIEPIVTLPAQIRANPNMAADKNCKLQL